MSKLTLQCHEKCCSKPTRWTTIRKEVLVSLTVKLFVPGNERGPHLVAAFLHQVLELLLALLVEFILHL